ncbi:tetratricopeptide repeat protein [Dactylosporangium sp. NPDC048998]|uniref:tetratricopeptide repeat protein n=1 Tax=Dactylosporangium sp. NPDC048998 TaxID=3363976 RepID=UPI003710614E
MNDERPAGDEQRNDPVAQAHGELSLARIALAEDDLGHAASHVAGAIAWAPGLPEAHELLAALVARAGDEGALELFPVEQPAFIGAVVARAHLQGRHDPMGGLRMLAQATRFDAAQPWADVSWVRAIEPRRLDPEDLARLFVAVMPSLGDPAERAVALANEVYLDLARRATTAHPGHALLHGAAAGLARRFTALTPGALAEAVRWGAHGHRLRPDKLTSVWYAYALKADGRLDTALQVMRQAWQAQPGEVDLCADMANWLAEAGRLDEAVDLLDAAMRRVPDYDCAVHTAARLRFQRDGDVRHLVALVDFMRKHPVTSHEHADLDGACRGRPWLSMVGGPAESVINLLHQVGRANQDRRDMSGTATVSALEVPSALAVVRRELPGLELTIEGPPPPSMVGPQRPDGRVLWLYDGLIARPAVPPPSRRARELLDGLVWPSWPNPVAAYDQALPLGQLGADDLVSLLVHPSPGTDEKLPDGVWERACQAYACLGLLHCEELRGGAEPGDTRRSRALLTAIAFGMEDWTTESALFALVVAAWLDPACREEVRGIVGRRFLDAMEQSRERVVTIREALAELVLVTPQMVPEVSALARDLLARRDGEDETFPPPPAAEPAKKRRWFGRR